MYTGPDWPAIIKHQDDAELTYIHNQAEWEAISQSGEMGFDKTDLLIDSSGNSFTVSGNDLLANQEKTDLESILGMVKGHAAQAGSCCVAKLYAPSIKDAFAIVKSMSDD